MAAVFAIQLALVPPARACSCVEPGGMADYRGDPDRAIFTAIVQPRDARGYPVIVTRWFQGGLFEPRVWFDAEAFSGDEGSCGIAPLPIATEWIFVAYRIDGRQELGTGLCSPHATLTGPDTAVGRAMLTDALLTFGGVPPVGTDPPPSSAPTIPTPADPVVGPAALTLLLVGLVGSIGFGAGLWLILVRRRRDA